MRSSFFSELKKNDPTKVNPMRAANEWCIQCMRSLPVNHINQGYLIQKISWEIANNMLYLSGHGSIIEEDYICVSAPAWRIRANTYSHILPWAVCPRICKTGIVTKACPVECIPNRIDTLVIHGEIQGLQDFLYHADESLGRGIELQPACEYYNRALKRSFGW